MRNFLFSNVKDFRYERKFCLEGIDRKEIETALRFHPAAFSEIYHERTVNNIYFDSFNMHHYYDNIDGVNRRLKVRIRWYGDLFGFIENPVLELKLKHNMHVGKIFYPLKAFTLDGSLSLDSMRDIFAKSSLSESLRLCLTELDFALLNSYRRKYFLSLDREYRITVDDAIHLYKLSQRDNSFLDVSRDFCSTILELKYSRPNDKFADGITRYFSFRMTRSSKYVNGITRLYS